MKLLLVGSFAKGAIESIYHDIFIYQGWQVIPYDIQSSYLNKINASFINKIVNRISILPFIKEINIELLLVAKKYKPTVICVFKGMELLPATVEELKSYTSLLINYNPDHPFKFEFRGSGNSNVIKSLPYYDVHFSYSKNITKSITDRLGKPAYTIPFGFDNSKKAKVISSLCDDIIFIGAYDLKRAQFFKDLNMPVKIYGDLKWKSRNRFSGIIKESFQGRAVVGQEYVDYSASALGALNILREQNISEGSHNMRTFEIPGYGGLLISNRTEEHQEYFEDKKEAIFFDSVDELKSVLTFIKTNICAAKKIKENAIKRSFKSNYTYAARVSEMVRLINQHL